MPDMGVPVVFGGQVPRRDHESDVLGACAYCATITWLTRDHKEPRWWRREQHRFYAAGGNGSQRSAGMTWVCSRCNAKKGMMRYGDWIAWLFTREAYDWLNQSRRRWRPSRSCEVPPPFTRADKPFYGRERHFCAAHKPCGILRMRMLVLDNDPSELIRYLVSRLPPGA